jgi:hypothetical protein
MKSDNPSAGSHQGDRPPEGINRRAFLEAGTLGTLGFTLAAVVEAPEAHAAPPAPNLRLETSRLAIELRPADGALVKLENRLTGDVKGVRSVPFQLATTRGEVAPRDCRLIRSAHEARSATFVFEGKGLEVQVGYRASSPEANAFEKTLCVTNRGKDTVTLDTLITDHWTVPDAFPGGYPHSYYPGGINQIHFHRSGLWYDHAINLFLRDDKGGVFLGVENPYFEASYRALRKVYPAVVEVKYRPRWLLAPGETFESDNSFFGVFRHEGVYCLRRAQVFFEGRARLSPEVLDWGEVWAMQEFMATLMPPGQTPTGGYYMTDWGHANPSRLGQISRKKEQGKPLTAEEQAMLAHFGGGPFRFAEQESWFRLTPETLPVYKKAVDDDAALGHYETLTVPNRWAGHTGWFISPEQQRKQKQVEQRIDTWFGAPAFPLWKELADYAQSKGLGLFTLEVAGDGYRPDRPEWKYLNAEGKRGTANCYANLEYAAWYTGQVSRALGAHPIRHWQWDEGWMDSVMGLIGEDVHCYDATHGHLPGNVSYHQFRGVLATLRTLKQRHPKVQFVIISGLIRGMPWLMRDLDGESVTGAMEPNPAWLDRNSYFLPPYKCHRRGGIHWILPVGSASIDSDQPADWYTMLEDPVRRKAYQAFWDKWMTWVNTHRAYLNVRRDLFLGEGVAGGLEGSAHCLADRGFLFLRNPTARLRVARIPVSHWLGLDAGDRFQLVQRYPAEESLGRYRRGEELLIPVKPGATLMLEISPDAAGTTPGTSPQVPPDAPVQKAFLTLTEALRLLGEADLWPSAPLPGQGKMRTF